MTPVTVPYTKSNFAPAFWLMAPIRRRALAAVYAFARVVDDAVDEVGDVQNNPTEARAVLNDWRFTLETGAVRRPEHAALWAELSVGISRFGLNKKHLFDLIQGVERDLTQTRYATAADVDVYCDGVASSVGLACLPIFGLNEEKHRDFAIALGRAVQWVNILRDVASDAARGRVYLPQNELKELGVAESEVLAGKNSEGLRAVIKRGAARARQYFQKADDALPRPDRPLARPALVMGRLYARLLDKIEKRDGDVFSSRPRLSLIDKFKILLASSF